MMLIMVLGHDLVGQSLSRMMQKNDDHEDNCEEY